MGSIWEIFGLDPVVQKRGGKAEDDFKKKGEDLSDERLPVKSVHRKGKVDKKQVPLPIWLGQ